MSRMRLIQRRLRRRFPREYHFLFGWHKSTAYLEQFDETQSIFIHVPKTGGQSLAMALYGRGINHRTWREWYERNPEKFARYFKFAVIRDPMTRFSSSFDFLKDGGMREQDKTFANAVLTPFSNANDLARALIDADLQAQVLRWWHFRPQADFVADELGRSKMDLLIRFENLQAGVEAVARRLNRQTRELPHLNKTHVRLGAGLDKEARDVLYRFIDRISFCGKKMLLRNRSGIVQRGECDRHSFDVSAQ